MANALTQASTVECGHEAGKVATASTAKLTVNQNPVLVASSIESGSISGCLTAPPPQTNKPCTLVTAVTAGKAAKLTVNSEPVMLDTLAGATDGAIGGAPQAFLNATAGQSKLTAV